MADVTKPLASVGRTTSKGHRIVLNDDSACIQQKKTDRKTDLHTKGNIFVMRVHVGPAKDDGMPDGMPHWRVPTEACRTTVAAR